MAVLLNAVAVQTYGLAVKANDLAPWVDSDAALALLCSGRAGFQAPAFVATVALVFVVRNNAQLFQLPHGIVQKMPAGWAMRHVDGLSE